jgi:hypothetical protein
MCLKGPELVIAEAGLDFGLVQIGNSSKSFITIENISNLDMKWNLSSSQYQVHILTNRFVYCESLFKSFN